MSASGAPVQANVVLGGYQGLDYLNASALVVTFLLNNSDKNNTAALAWEEQFLKIAAEPLEGLNVYYSSEVYDICIDCCVVRM
jgi:hypothetical protein